MQEVSTACSTLKLKTQEFRPDDQRCALRGIPDALLVVIWSSLIDPAMDCARHERISGESD